MLLFCQKKVYKEAKFFIHLLTNLFQFDAEAQPRRIPPGIVTVIIFSISLNATGSKQYLDNIFKAELNGIN